MAGRVARDAESPRGTPGPGSNDSGNDVPANGLGTLSISKKLNAPEFRTPNKMVTFYIGEDREEFVVHREHAIRYSPVFDRAFHSEFVEGQTQKYAIDDTTPSAFRFLVQWLYTQTLGHIQLLEDYAPGKTEKEKEKCVKDRFLEMAALLELWVLAGKLLLPQLQNQVMEVLNNILFEDYDHCLTMVIVRIDYVYTHTDTESPLRRFVVHWMAWALPTAVYKNFSRFYPRQFLLDLAVVFSSAVPPRAAENRILRTDCKEFYVEEEF